jgi:acetolactate synthase-1/2/3 large subunit
VSASSIPTLVRNAFRIAAEERPGPVHLELPEDQDLAPVRLGRSMRGRPV